jgi:hypothetical protein
VGIAAIHRYAGCDGGTKEKRKKAMESCGEPRRGATRRVTSQNESPPALPDLGHAKERQARAYEHGWIQWSVIVFSTGETHDCHMYIVVCGQRSYTQESVLLGVTTRPNQTLRHRPFLADSYVISIQCQCQNANANAKARAPCPSPSAGHAHPCLTHHTLRVAAPPHSSSVQYDPTTASYPR